MKRFCLLLLMLSLPWCGRAAYINGQNYVSLAEWAKSNGFNVAAWSRDQVVLANRGARLVFNLDSSELTINGVDIRLSFPVAKGGLVSQLDLDTAIGPVVFPKKTPGKTI